MKFLNPPNFLDLSDTTALITGGAGMLGRQYTAALLKCGSNVIILDNKSSKKNLVTLLKKESKLDEKKLSHLTLVKCDITDYREVKKTFTSLRDSLKNLKILVNNASLVKQVNKNSDLINTYKPFLKMIPKDWEDYFSIDLTGTLLVTQQSIPYMQKNGGGSIINISSTSGITGSPFEGAYTASKGAVRLFTKSAALHAAKDNIRINSVHPATTDTSMVEVIWNSSPDIKKTVTENVPLGRLAEPYEIAKTVLFLASDDSSYMTGSELIVDGGMTAI